MKRQMTAAVLAGVMILGMLGMLAFFLGGCSTTTPKDQVQQIVAVGGLLALDIDAVRKDGATPEERQALDKDVGRAVALVGISSSAGQSLTRLLADYAATGNFPEDAWRAAVRVLLEWAAEPANPAK